jgi:hypothetical protein
MFEAGPQHVNLTIPDWLHSTGCIMKSIGHAGGPAKRPVRDDTRTQRTEVTGIA